MKETIQGLKLKVIALLAGRKHDATTIMNQAVMIEERDTMIEKANEEIEFEQDLNASLMEQIKQLEEN